jgi:hypothetical protein
MARDYTPKISKSELEHGAYYAGSCRNASVARWDATHGHFRHRRTKFGQTFIEEIKCPEDESQFDVFVTDRKIEAPEAPIPLLGERSVEPPGAPVGDGR